MVLLQQFMPILARQAIQVTLRGGDVGRSNATSTIQLIMLGCRVEVSSSYVPGVVEDVGKNCFGFGFPATP